MELTFQDGIYRQISECRLYQGILSALKNETGEGNRVTQIRGYWDGL